MVIIAQNDPNNWPSDDEWLKLLPEWFTNPFKDITLEELINNKELWDYSSWLEAMRLRGWTWWSSRYLNDRWEIKLNAYEHPYSIGPLEYLARASGADSLEFVED
jgi:hypothetical protein